MTDRHPHPADGEPVRDPSEDVPLDPAEMLALVRDQQDHMNRRQAASVPWILLAWGVAWLVGFGLLWAIDGAGEAVSVPLPVAASAFAGLMAAALVVSGVLGAWTGRGIRSSPGAAFTGTVYGITWMVSFVALFVFGSALIHNGMDRDLASIFYPTGSALVVGILYLVAGAIWRVVPAIVMGGWIIFVGLVAPFFGYPAHYLVFALAGGGVFLAGAGFVAVYTRSRRRPSPGLGSIGRR